MVFRFWANEARRRPDLFPLGRGAKGMTRIAIVAALGFLLWGQSAWAQNIQRIAAIVNDQVISAYDLQQRVKLVLATSGIQPTKENIDRLSQQVLRSLIDEQLQLQEASKNEIKVQSAEVDQEITRLARQSNLSADQILGLLEQQGISSDTLRTQIMAEIAWAKLVQGRFAPRINVSGEEIDQVYERLKANRDRPQYLVSEIFLPVDSPDRAQAVQQTALRLIQQIRDGAPFPQIARNWSQSASASRGGDIGWVQDGQLEPELNQVISRMQPGRVSPPVPTVSGFYILALRERRIVGTANPLSAEMTLYEITIPLNPKAPEEEWNRAGQVGFQIASRVPSCQVAEELARNNAKLLGNHLGTLQLSAFPKELQKKLVSLSAGDSTEPIRTPDGVRVMFVCDRQSKEEDVIPREAVENQLFNQQLSMMARRYLRDLRRDSTVEMR